MITIRTIVIYTDSVGGRGQINGLEELHVLSENQSALQSRYCSAVE